MRMVNIFRLRVRSLFRRSAVESELDEELRYHFERQMEQAIASGVTAQDARREAQRSAAGGEQRKEECRDVRGLALIDHAMQDFRYAFRQLRKSPAFACTAIFVLTLGIAATVAILGFIDAALIKPLPYRDQARLVGAFESSPGYARSMVSYLNFSDWKRLNRVFSSIDAYAMNGSFTLTNSNGAEQVRGTRVSSGFFHTLGVVPVLGRDFLPREDSVGAGRTVILSYAAWQKRFSGKQDVLGRTLTLNGAPTTIVGVLPRGFQFALYGADFWGNLRGSDICEQSRGCRNLYMVARLNDGVSIERAAARMRSIAVRLRKQYPGANRDLGSVALVPLRDVIVGDVRPVLLVLLAGAALLLLIACVNVSTLLLARSDKRRREFAVRGALGASSSRLFRQFAMEGLALAALGCCLGLLSAHWGMRFLSGIVPPDEMDSMPYLRGLGLNLFTAAAGCGILLMAGVLFSVIPIMRTFAAEAMEGLKEGARGSAGTTWRRFGSNLVIAEVAIAMVLMAGAGLLGKSLYLLLHVDLGFTPERLVQLQTSWKPADYTTDRQKIVLAGELMRRISSLPGVASVALSTAPPVDSAWGTASFHVAGRANRGEANEALQRQVSSTYFATLQARLLRGRYFREDEDASKPSVVVINRALSNKYFPGEDPVGIQLYYDGQPQSPMRVVGVVEDIKEGSLEAGNMAAMYVPFNQKPVAWPAILVRASSREAPLLPRIVQATHGVDPFITVSQGETMTQRINQSPSAYLHRSAAVLVGVFAGSALLLSVVGLYGVVAYSVSQRTREIGVRMALGAGRESVHRMIMREAARLTGFGIVLGLAGSLGGAILLRTLLFDVRSWDVPTLTAVVAVLGVSTLAASYVPARRAAAVNPVEALRAE